MIFGNRNSSGRGRMGGFGIKILIALAIAGFSLFTYFNSSEVNPVTGEKQRVGGIKPEQEIAMGLQAFPQMAQEFGGLSTDEQAQKTVDDIGNRIVSTSDAHKSPYKFDFHVLADSKTVNAFALPGGQIFITEALLSQLQTPGQVAGVLGHEIGHVVGRHSAEHLAKQKLTAGLTGAAVIAASDSSNPASTAQMAQMVGQMINMKYTREDETESDRLGVQYMIDAKYDPSGMITVMEVLKKAGGGGGAPEFMSSHPDPGNRAKDIQNIIKEKFPNGVPAGLEK